MAASGNTLAATRYQDSIKIYRELLKRDQSNREWQSALSGNLEKLGDQFTQRHDAALVLYEESLAIRTKLSLVTEFVEGGWIAGYGAFPCTRSLAK